MSLTVEQLRQHLTTSLGDEALAQKLAAAYEAIDSRFGLGGDTTELFDLRTGDLLVLSWAASSITSLVEDDIELTAGEDFMLVTPTLLRRIHSGPHPSNRWRGRLVVTYGPIANEAERDRVAIALVALEINFQPGLASRRLGEYAESFAQGSTDYAGQREAILASYDGAGGAFV